MKHECPIDGCSIQLPQHILMCRLHWYKVAEPLRDAVVYTWKYGPRGDYLNARQSAIDCVHQKIAKVVQHDPMV